MKHVISSLVLCALIAGGFFLLKSPGLPPAPSAVEMKLNDLPIRLDMAVTSEAQYQGLSDREDLCRQCGMLFTFDSPREHTFVMRRMKFPLDIVWIRSGRILRIDRNLAPESAEPYTPYPSGAPVDQVLELKAGGAGLYGLQEGAAFNLQ